MMRRSYAFTHDNNLDFSNKFWRCENYARCFMSNKQSLHMFWEIWMTEHIRVKSNANFESHITGCTWNFESNHFEILNFAVHVIKSILDHTSQNVENKWTIITSISRTLILCCLVKAISLPLWKIKKFFVCSSVETPQFIRRANFSYDVSNNSSRFLWPENYVRFPLMSKPSNPQSQEYILPISISPYRSELVIVAIDRLWFIESLLINTSHGFYHTCLNC